MKKSKKIITIICIVIIILSICGYFVIDYILDKDIEKQQQELQEIINKYGTVNEENVNTIVAKFNTEVMENGSQYPASNENSRTENNVYWHLLSDDIYLFVKPLEFTGDNEKDIVSTSTINYPNDLDNEETAIQYVKNLIKANNTDLSYEEINQLINDAKEAFTKQSGTTANNGKGISVAFVEDESNCEYQIIRLLPQN